MSAAPVNYIVKRRSPDWLTFDLEDTRAFCRSVGTRDDAVIAYAEAWNAATCLDYRHYRQAMKDISAALIDGVHAAVVVTHAELGGLEPGDDDLLYFTDDDDWAAPDLFVELRRAGAAGEGWLWLSLGVTKAFTAGEPLVGADVVVERPAASWAHTNNYAVTGRTWRVFGAEGLLEHYDAQKSLDQGGYNPDRLNRYLTAANKHMCCTGFIDRNGQAPHVVGDLRGCLASYQADLERVRLNARTRWIEPALSRLRAVNALALG